MNAPHPGPVPEKPKLFADERGVWIDRKPGSRTGIEWLEVYRVIGHRFDGITETYPCVELELEFGEWIDLYSNWPGFQNVVAEISRRLPGISTTWFQNVERLQVGDPAIECWHREQTPRVSD